MAYTFYPFKLTPADMPVDILRMQYNKSLELPINNLYVGHSQNGKSTDVFHNANMWYHLKRYGPLWKYYPVNWRAWNWKRLCCRTAYQFVDVFNKSRGEFIVLEEAADDGLLNYLNWYGVMADVFNSTRDTQGYLGNSCTMITPHADELIKKAKEKIDFKLWAYKKQKWLMRNTVRPRWVDIDYIKDKVRFRYCNDWNIDFTYEELQEAKKYTTWLEKFKEDIAAKNERKVGIRKRMILCFNCGDKHEVGKCPLNEKGVYVEE